MKYELDCKWHFAKIDSNSGAEGPNSALTQTFKQFPWESLVRESIQNSLDVPANPNEPVIVCFEHRSFERQDYPNFFKLSDHIKAGLDFFTDVDAANAMYPPMIKYLQETEEVGYIRISDYNTIGMTYDPKDPSSTFATFVRSAGVSVKKAIGAGGAFGFGKGAFFAMSPINTLIVSTQTLEGNRYFEGVTRLCTHEINNERRNHVGFYDNNGGQPTSENANIPFPFQRSEPGTSIGIMGIDSKTWNASSSEIIKAVLVNFFAAILYNKLEVYVNGNPEKEGRKTIIINKNNIKELIEKFYPTTEISRNEDNPFNPRPHFEALTDLQPTVFQERLPILGAVTLYVKEFEGNPTSIVGMRKHLMKIQDIANKKNLPFNGVFICADPKGNAILGDMENSTHTVWDPQYADDDRVATKYETAKKAKRELSKFLQKCFNKLSATNTKDLVQIADLEKYLPAESEDSKKGEKGNPFSGTPTGNYTQEGASMTTESSVLKEVSIKDINSKGTIIHIQNDVSTSNSGPDNLKEPTGTKKSKNNRGGGKPGPGDNWNNRTITLGDGRVKRLVDIDWRPLQRKEKGVMDIIIYAPKDLYDCEISFLIGRESSKGRPKNEDVVISSVNRPEAELDGLTIKKISLRGKGKNILRVEFSDHMNHTLDIAVYEFD